MYNSIFFLPWLQLQQKQRFTNAAAKIVRFPSNQDTLDTAAVHIEHRSNIHDICIRTITISGLALDEFIVLFQPSNQAINRVPKNLKTCPQKHFLRPTQVSDSASLDDT